MFDRFFRSRSRVTPDACVPDGQRLYAVGDIHGRLDLLNALLAVVYDDDRRSAPAQTTLIFLGDIIDRGPDSAAVVERLRQLAIERPSTHFLRGNHEEMFLGALAGDLQALRGFCQFGGRATILSYGITDREFERMDYAQVQDALVATVPAEHLRFLQQFEDLVVIGDYAFVHAGIDPGVPLDEQSERALRWIRSPFLNHDGPLEKVIVHGHTVSREVEWHPHRIGIDTGAYETGRLTALRLEGRDRQTLRT